MKKYLLISILSLVLTITWGGEGLAQTQKEMTFSGTHYFGGTSKIFRLDQDSIIVQLEVLGVRVNDSGEGPFHGASVHIVGVNYMGKGEIKFRAFETWTDKDGDKVVWELVEKETKDAPAGSMPGTAKIIGATGKFAGTEGTIEWLLQMPKAFPEGTSRGICREVVKISLPK